MMDYANTSTLGYAGEQGCVSDRPYMARIGDAADEADRIANVIQNFIDRCRGGGESMKAGPTPVPSGHFGQLDRLGTNMARLDALTRELNSIG